MDEAPVTTPPQELTIDQLAQRMGMTVRNVREWQALGLVQPPEKRGRTGYYGPGHLARVERIKELRADGFPLDLIRRILEADQGADDDLTRFARVLVEPFQDEAPEVVDASDLAARFKVTDGDVVKRAMERGLLRMRSDGRVELPNPRLARVGEALIELGLTLDELLDLNDEVSRHQEAVAELFVEVYRERFWEPFVRAGGTGEGWGEVGSMLERLRPLALETVVATFKLAMDRAAERAIGEETHRLLDPER